MRSNSLKTSIVLGLLISFVINVMFFLAFLYVRSNFSHPPGIPETNMGFEVFDLVLRFTINFVISFLVAFTFFKLSEKMPKKKTKIIIITLLCILITIAISYAFSKWRMFFFHRNVDGRFVLGSLFRDLFVTLITLFSAQIIYLSRKQQQSAFENQKLVAESMQSRYQALKNQIDPHFLFNSLNTLNALIKTDTKKAEEYVIQLSHVFRYILQQETIINVNDELYFTQAYCNLMKIRYGDNLNFNFDINNKYDNYKLVPLSLQLLVENAIKHNIITARQPLSINIISDDEEGITVINKIQPKKDVSPGTKIGLSNLSERYRLMTQKEIIITNNNEFFSVRVPIFKTL